MMQVTNNLQRVASECLLASEKAELFGTKTDQLGANQKLLQATIEGTQQKIALYSNKISALNNDTEKLKGRQNQLKNELTNTNKAYQDSVNATGKNSAESKKLADEISKLEREYSKNEKAIMSNDKELTKTITTMNKAETSILKDSKALENVTKELEKTKNEANKLNLKESMDKAGTGIESTQSKLSGLKNAFLGVTATIAGGFGLFSFTENAIKAGDNAYTLSQKLHISATEATALNKVLTITGTDVQPVISVLTKLDKSLESAGSSGNSTTKMLQQYGVALKDSSGKLLPMNSQLEALATAYKKASDAGNEEAFSAEVLGNKGQELIPLLEQYTEAKEEASKIKGIGIDPEEAHKTEEELKVLKAQVSATSGVVAKALIPVVEEVLPPLITLFQKIAEKVKDNKAELDKFIQSAITIGKELGTVIKPIIEGIFNFISNHGEATKNIIIGFIGAWAGLSGVKGIINGITGAMDTWNKAMKIKDKISAVIGVMKEWNLATKAMTLVQGALNLVMSLNPITLFAIAIGAVVAVLVIAYNKCEWFRDGVNAVFGYIKDVFSSFNDWLGSVFATDWSQRFGAFGEIMNAYLANARNIWDSVKQVFSGVIDFIAGVFTGDWGRAWEGIKEIFSGVFDGLYSIAVAPLNAIIGLVNSAIDSINGFSFDMPSVLGGGHIGLNVPNIPYLADGGIVNQATLSVIGEAGKEAVLPLERGNSLDILANKLLSKMPSGGNNNQPIYVSVNVENNMDSKQLNNIVASKVTNIINRQQGQRRAY